ncbi:MAG: hypothetical protein HY800_04100 [Ignavibacteriales bacterium]|nr:hypothetical protein [Ignavibacteriales bacterium]
MHIGLVTHEFGHIIGFYDDYVSYQSRYSSKTFNLMALGLWNGPLEKGGCPASLSPYERCIVKNWVAPILLTRDTTNFKVIYDYQNPRIYRVNPFNRDPLGDECYLFEIRLRKGFDLYLPTTPDSFQFQPGNLLIWHLSFYSTVDPLDCDSEKVALVPADNNRNYYYLKDFFPMDSILNRQSYNDITTPKTLIGDDPNVKAHFDLSGIRRHRPTSPSDSDYAIIDTIALRRTYATGIISQNTAWQYDVRVVGDVTVQSGVNLTIMPGTNIKIGPGYTLTVNGKLIAKGDINNRITFTSSNPVPQSGDWGGITCSGGGPDTLTYCDIKYAVNGIQFVNTAANSSMFNDTISRTSDCGVFVSNTNWSNPSLKMYKCVVSNNDKSAVKVNNARVLISHSKMENNEQQQLGPATVYVCNGGRVYIDSTRIQNNVYLGLEASGTSSRAILSIDEYKKGYNTLYQNGGGEVYVHNSARAILGFSAKISYCSCPDQTSVPNASVPGCPPGCTLKYSYEPRAGYNNVYDSYTFPGRLVNNTSDTTVPARYIYWGTHRASDTVSARVVCRRGWSV